MRLEPYWAEAWSTLGLAVPPGVLGTLMERYREPHRHYHNLQHLCECFEHFEYLRVGSEYPAEILLAIWFHDAIYDTAAHDNEARSAAWAVNVLLDAGAPVNTIARVEALIMATRHDSATTTPDQQVLTDIDLGILGASPDRFAEYERQIRAEYGWVPEPDFIEARRRVVLGMLLRPRIYHQPVFMTRELAARRNLKYSLERLESLTLPVLRARNA